MAGTNDNIALGLKLFNAAMQVLPITLEWWNEIRAIMSRNPAIKEEMDKMLADTVDLDADAITRLKAFLATVPPADKSPKKP